MIWIKVDDKLDLGLLPEMVSEDDPRPAREQFDENYVGGWKPRPNFKLANGCLWYPGDPPLEPLARTTLRDEKITLFPYDWVVIQQADESFEVARMD